MSREYCINKYISSEIQYSCEEASCPAKAIIPSSTFVIAAATVIPYKCRNGLFNLLYVCGSWPMLMVLGKFYCRI